MKWRANRYDPRTWRCSECAHYERLTHLRGPCVHCGKTTLSSNFKPANGMTIAQWADDFNATNFPTSSRATETQP